METAPPKKNTEFDPKNFFESFIFVAKAVLLQPAKFFHQMPKTGGIKNPFIFLLICSFFFALFVANLKGGDFNLFLLYFFANTFSAFVQSLVYHLIISRLFAKKAPYDATFRLIAYINVLSLVSWIPLIFISMAVNIYSVYLTFLGLQIVHRLKSREAGITILSFFLVALLLVSGLFLAAGGNMEQGMELLNP